MLLLRVITIPHLEDILLSSVRPELLSIFGPRSVHVLLLLRLLYLCPYQTSPPLPLANWFRCRGRRSRTFLVTSLKLARRDFWVLLFGGLSLRLLLVVFSLCAVSLSRRIPFSSDNDRIIEERLVQCCAPNSRTRRQQQEHAA